MAVQVNRKKRTRQRRSHRHRTLEGPNDLATAIKKPQLQQQLKPPVSPNSTPSLQGLLPRVGFKWPVFESTFSTKMRAYQLALHADHIAAIKLALRHTHTAVCSERYNPTGPPPRLNKAFVDEQLAALFNTATQVLPEPASLTALRTQTGGQVSFWAKVMAAAPFWPDESHYKAWFSSSYKHVPRLRVDALESLAVLVRSIDKRAFGAQIC